MLLNVESWFKQYQKQATATDGKHKVIEANMFVYVNLSIIVLMRMILTCSKALAVYVTRMAGKVPRLMALLKTSEEEEEDEDGSLRTWQNTNTTIM